MWDGEGGRRGERRRGWERGVFWIAFRGHCCVMCSWKREERLKRRKKEQFGLSAASARADIKDRARQDKLGSG